MQVPGLCHIITSSNLAFACAQDAAQPAVAALKNELADMKRLVQQAAEERARRDDDVAAIRAAVQGMVLSSLEKQKVQLQCYVLLLIACKTA
jgi:Spy/CpxP family protein refolding chaperone